MKKKKTNCSKAPEDFDISIYEICKSWELKDWAIQLDYRSFMATVFKDAENGKVTNDCLDSLKETADQLIQQPLKNELTRSNIYLSPIVDQSAEDFFMGHHVINDRPYENWVTKMRLAEQYGDEIDGGDTSLSKDIYQSVREFNSTPAWKVRRDSGGSTRGNMHERFFIGVNLNASDDYLIEKFKGWISKTRRKANVKEVKRKFKKEDLLKWHDDCLLPYLDLKFWALVNRKKINSADMEEALFPNLPDSLTEGERIRKTIAPNALKLVSKEFIYSLNAQLRTYG